MSETPITDANVAQRREMMRPAKLKLTEDLREASQMLLEASNALEACHAANEDLLRLRKPMYVGEGTMRLAQSALRQWSEMYGEWSEEMPERMRSRLPPGNHLKALEALEEALEAIRMTPPERGR